MAAPSTPDVGRQRASPLEVARSIERRHLNKDVAADSFHLDVVNLAAGATQRGISLHIEVEPTATSGLDEISYVQCELIRSVNQGRLVHLMGRIDSDTSDAVSLVVRTLLNHLDMILVGVVVG